MNSPEESKRMPTQELEKIDPDLHAAINSEEPPVKPVATEALGKREKNNVIADNGPGIMTAISQMPIGSELSPREIWNFFDTQFILTDQIKLDLTRLFEEILPANGIHLRKISGDGMDAVYERIEPPAAEPLDILHNQTEEGYNRKSEPVVGESTQESDIETSSRSYEEALDEFLAQNNGKDVTAEMFWDYFYKPTALRMGLPNPRMNTKVKNTIQEHFAKLAGEGKLLIQNGGERYYVLPDFPSQSETSESTTLPEPESNVVPVEVAPQEETVVETLEMRRKKITDRAMELAQQGSFTLQDLKQDQNLDIIAEIRAQSILNDLKREGRLKMRRDDGGDARYSLGDNQPLGEDVTDNPEPAHEDVPEPEPNQQEPEKVPPAPASAAPAPQVETPAEPLTPEAIEEIEKRLVETRSAYAEKLAEYKLKVKKDQKGWEKISEQLGINKPRPYSELPDEVRDAERAYIDAKLKKKELVRGKEQRNKEVVKKLKRSDGKTEKHTITQVIDVGLMKYAEEEYEVFQKMVMQSMPEAEKSELRKKLSKALEIYNRQPWWLKVATSSLIMTSSVAAAGAIGITSGIGGAGGALAYAGYRVGKGLAAAGAGGATVQVMDLKFTKKNKDEKEKFLEEYASSSLGKAEDPITRERKLTQAFEEAERKKKRQLGYKALGAVTVAGVTGLAVPSLARAANNAVDSISGPRAHILEPKGSAGNVIDNKSGNSASRISERHGGKRVPVGSSGSSTAEAMQGGKTHTAVAEPKPVDSVKPPASSVTEKPAVAPEQKGSVSVETKTSTLEPGTKAPVSTPQPEAPVEVELSDKGFIKTFDDLKAKLTEQYGSADKVPAKWKHLMETPSTKLAEEFGFYDSKTGMSGMGMHGDKLVAGSKGLELVSESKLGTSQIISDTEHFKGPMRHFEASAKVPVAAAEVLPDTDPDAAHAQVEMPAPADAPQYNYPTDGEVATTPVEAHIDPQAEISATAIPPEAGDHLYKLPVDPFDSKPIKIPYGTGHEILVNTQGARQSILFDGKPIGWAQIKYGYSVNQVLDDRFQDGKQYADIRAAFNKAVESIPNKTTMQVINEVSFESGKIQLVQGVEGVDQPHTAFVLLNGKQIGVGVVDAKTNTLHLDQKLKGGIFFADTVYERAWKAIKPVIKQYQQDIQPRTH